MFRCSCLLCNGASCAVRLFVQSSPLETVDSICGYLSCGIMQSTVCHLRGLDQRQMVAAKEEETEMGGLVSLLDCHIIPF